MKFAAAWCASLRFGASRAPYFARRILIALNEKCDAAPEAAFVLEDLGLTPSSCKAALGKTSQ
jgi:hypothetical protein